MKGAQPKTERFDERFEMRTSTHLLRSVDDWRRQQPDLPSRSEAIRRLIEAGLSVAAKPSVTSPEVPAAQGKGLPLSQLGASQEQPESGASKPAARKPRAKPAAMSKEAQIRALRERSS